MCVLEECVECLNSKFSEQLILISTTLLDVVQMASYSDSIVRSSDEKILMLSKIPKF